jgi:uncharacterized membrane protein
MAKHTSHTTTKSKVLIALSIVVIAVLGASVYQVRNTKAFVDASTHQPERYTELYFSDPTTIPTTAAEGRQLPVSFTIHNVEAKDMKYTYDLTFTTAVGKTLIQEQQSFSLLTNDSKTITTDIQVPAYSGKAEVQILLPSLHQSIHFWVLAR